MIQRIHEHRPKHQRNMSYALSMVEYSNRNKRQAKEMTEAGLAGGSPLLIQGFSHIQDAIRALVECGCPREMWPMMVKEAIPPA